MLWKIVMHMNSDHIPEICTRVKICTHQLFEKYTLYIYRLWEKERLTDLYE